jgi:molybdopterin molybdotransferase
VISVEEARERILSNVTVLDPEEKPILEAMGQVLAEDVHADLDVPPLDNSAMDGYAVRAADVESASEASPVRLKVLAEVAAGYLLDGEVTAGGAVRIMTGAPIPRGADAVVIFEDTDEASERSSARHAGEVQVFKPVGPGANIRRAGEDLAKGSSVLRRGTVLRPAQIGVLASLGRAAVRVIRRPVVAVLATGDELVEVGEPLEPGKIYNSNTYSIASMVRQNGGIPKILGIARDSVDALTAKIRQGLDADMLVTSAGVSRGDFDVVKDVLAREGEIGFWTVRMRPGKPLAFGSFPSGSRTVPHIGLPGNPVSSMITFEMFGRPAIFKMLGATDWERPQVRVICQDRIRNTDGRRVFARGFVEEREGRYFASLTGPQGSGILTSMASANALVVVPEDVASVEAGDEATAIMLDWSQGSI